MTKKTLNNIPYIKTFQNKRRVCVNKSVRKKSPQKKAPREGSGVGLGLG